jgi:hypothetical protein
MIEAVANAPEAPKLEAVPLPVRGAKVRHGARPGSQTEPAGQTADDARAGEPVAARRYGTFAPMLLTLLSLLVWFGFQGVQLWIERASFERAVERQAPRVERAQQFRSEFESLGADTAHLAAVGNANAKQVVDALKQGGVAIDAPKSAASRAGAPGGPH